MANPATKHEFLVVIPDKAGSGSARRELTPLHGQAMKHDGDFWIAGGPVCANAASDLSQAQVTGSFMIVYAESLDKVTERLKNDHLTKGNVWDLEQAKIWPIISLARKPLPNH